MGGPWMKVLSKKVSETRRTPAELRLNGEGEKPKSKQGVFVCCDGSLELKGLE